MREDPATRRLTPAPIWPTGRKATGRRWPPGVVDPPADFADAHQAVVDNLQVSDASYELDSVERRRQRGGPLPRHAPARGLGEWKYDGTLSLHRGDDEWRVEWAPDTIHPELGQGEHLERTRVIPERAPILDANDQPIATGRPARIVGLEPRAILDLDQIKSAFQLTLGIDPAAIDEALNAPAWSRTTSSPSPPSTSRCTTGWRR